MQIIGKSLGEQLSVNHGAAICEHATDTSGRQVSEHGRQAGAQRGADLLGAI